jgi:hypothetical protein
MYSMSRGMTDSVQTISGMVSAMSRKRRSLSSSERSTRHRAALNSVMKRHNATKMANPSSYSDDRTNESAGGMSQYSTPIQQISEASRPGPRPPYQPARTTATSGSW